MKTRIFTGCFIAIFFIGVILATFIWERIIFDASIMLISVGAIFEIWSCISHKRNWDEIIICFVAFFGCCGVILFVDGLLSVLGYIFLILISAVIIELLICMFSSGSLVNVTDLILILFYPIALLVCLILLNHINNQSLNGIENTLILLLFTVSPFTDVFAYFGGTLLKGPKLCPKISPKKTISGAVCGLLGGLVAAGFVLLIAFVPAFKWLNLHPFTNDNGFIINVLIMGLFGSIFNQLGDLIASYIKRQNNIKDFGKILPGHGGIMDRIDGMLLNGFFLFAYTIVFQLLV